MRLVTLFLIAAFAAPTVGVGSYQDGADLSYAHLYKANLYKANLGGADPLSLTGSGIRCFFVASDAKVNRLGDSRIWRP